MYTFKHDMTLIRDNTQLKLLYTIFEQNERIINLLSQKDVPEALKEPEAPKTMEAPEVIPAKKYVCEKCGMEFDKAIYKATHARKCKA